MRRLARTLLAATLVIAVAPRGASADTLVTPFIGFTYAGQTAFLVLDPELTSEAIPKNVIFGGSWTWLSDRVLGIEGEFALAPGFFEARNVQNLITGSHVMTLLGNVITALPVGITREGLRPYLLGGFGLVRVKVEDLVGLGTSDNSPGLQLGGGAIGFITDRTGLRFDVRYTRSLDRTTDEITLDRRSKLSFWRASVGVAISY
jgi:opacity protein-like surface antigen